MKLEFLRWQHEVGEVHSFFFSTDPMPRWEPGQYLNLSMPEVAPVFADRLFTIASAPHENVIQITTIMTPSPFKQKLATLQVGDEIEADQLGGDFTYNIPPHVIPTEVEGSDENTKSRSLDKLEMTKRLFIAGGIGVTPYISIIRDRLHKKQPINATLLYAGKSDRRPFLNELEEAAKTDPTLQIKHYASTRLTLEQLKNDTPDISNWIVYLAGSQKFSETLGEGLVANGHPRNQIKYDYFDGYIDIEY